MSNLQASSKLEKTTLVVVTSVTTNWPLWLYYSHLKLGVSPDRAAQKKSYLTAVEDAKVFGHKFYWYHLHQNTIKLIYYKYSSPVFTACILVPATSFELRACRCLVSFLKANSRKAVQIQRVGFIKDIWKSNISWLSHFRWLSGIIFVKKKESEGQADLLSFFTNEQYQMLKYWVMY